MAEVVGEVHTEAVARAVFAEAAEQGAGKVEQAVLRSAQGQFLFARKGERQRGERCGGSVERGVQAEVECVEDRHALRQRRRAFAERLQMLQLIRVFVAIMRGAGSPQPSLEASDAVGFSRGLVCSRDERRAHGSALDSKTRWSECRPRRAAFVAAYVTPACICRRPSAVGRTHRSGAGLGPVWSSGLFSRAFLL